MPRPREVRYQAFILTGVAVGVVVAAVLAIAGSPKGQYSSAAVFGYLAVFFALLGALAGGGVAVGVEALMRRRSRPSEVAAPPHLPD